MPPKTPAVETVVVRELECELTQAELLDRGDAMASCESQVETLKAERRRLNASIRDESNKRSNLAKIIESKHETRDVSCVWEPDYEAREYVLRRQDNRIEVERREMPEADLQMHLLPTPITKAAASAGKTAKKSRAN